MKPSLTPSPRIKISTIVQTSTIGGMENYPALSGFLVLPETFSQSERKRRRRTPGNILLRLTAWSELILHASVFSSVDASSRTATTRKAAFASATLLDSQA